MYARVASFEGRESSLTDELIQRARDRGPSSVPDAKGFLGLLDRERGTSLSITFFDSEEAIRNSEQAFEDMAQNFPPEMRGRRTSVDALEVMISEGDAERAKAARVSTLEGSAESIEGCRADELGHAPAAARRAGHGRRNRSCRPRERPRHDDRALGEHGSASRERGASGPPAQGCRTER